MKQKIQDEFNFLMSAIRQPHEPVDGYIRILTALLPSLFLVAVIFQPWVDPKWLFLDVITAAEFSDDCCHSYFGFVSTAGIILWASTASICLFTAIILYLSRNKNAQLKFAVIAGIFTGLLTLDDAFLVHEAVLPSLGINQELVLALYAVLAMAYVFISWRIILSYDFWILAAGITALIISLIIDISFHSLDSRYIVWEDDAKFLGIFFWASFHITTSIKLVIAKIGTDQSGHLGH